MARIYAIRQAVAKAIVSYFQKYEASKKEIKEILIQYDRSLFVVDPRHCGPDHLIQMAIFRRVSCDPKNSEVLELVCSLPEILSLIIYSIQSNTSLLFSDLSPE